jgi:predicted amidohydrolase
MREVNVTLTLNESATAVMALQGTPIPTALQRDAESAVRKITAAAKRVVMPELFTPRGPTIESVALAACGDAL